MHKNIHRLLLYKDKLVTDRIFNSDDDFKNTLKIFYLNSVDLIHY